MSIASFGQLKTESVNGLASQLNDASPEAALGLLLDGQVAAAQSVRSALPQIATAAEQIANCINAGGKLAYIGAGSSGLMALADGLELQGTFGIPQSRIRILFAGGPACLEELRGGPEDDGALARADVDDANIGSGDCAILVSASGRTPYTLAALQQAQVRGAKCIGLANNSPSPLLEASDIPIHLPTPPELIAGSTRMGAGTAQKIALNMLSTLTGMHLGHVYNGMMVNLQADNDKLQDRACRMVMEVSGCTEDAAQGALGQASGSVKAATLLAVGASSLHHAEELLGRYRGKLGPAISDVSTQPTKNQPRKGRKKGVRHET
ncbi:MAG: N-acetylmuramic acid 6-phosphate etherase [Pseudomonadota bacterium]